MFSNVSDSVCRYALVEVRQEVINNPVKDNQTYLSSVTRNLVSNGLKMYTFFHSY